MNTAELFKQALDHREEHGCSAYPYEEGERLIEILQKHKPVNILEIGTGIGYSTVLMALALPEAKILTVEKDLEHVEFAEQFFSQNGVGDRVVIVGQPAEGYLEDLIDQFDFIVFDGYQIHYEFLPHYERLLKPGGILYLGNNHLKSRTSEKFFTELGNEKNWKILQQFAETTIAQRL